MAFLYEVFTVFKFLLGLGALGGLIAIGGMLLWFLGHVIVRRALRGQPDHRCLGLRKVFLEL
ncbi:hypothetical protein NKDENANG_00174 [Candidatus Entotheonellaceae bacterium PAL068K]